MTVKLNNLIPELYVSNINKSLAFYTRLDFKILYQREAEKFIFLEREDVQLMLEELNDNSWNTGTMEAPFGRGINFQIQVNDVDPLYATALRNGFKIYLPLYEKWYRINEQLRGNRQFLIQDPDGYLLRFSQDLGNKGIPRLYAKDG